jgi:hypothetical protein
VSPRACLKRSVNVFLLVVGRCYSQSVNRKVSPKLVLLILTIVTLALWAILFLDARQFAANCPDASDLECLRDKVETSSISYDFWSASIFSAIYALPIWIITGVIYAANRRSKAKTTKDLVKKDLIILSTIALIVFLYWWYFQA